MLRPAHRIRTKGKAMSTSIGIDEAQAKLKDIIAALGPDDEVVITDQNRPIARILRTSKPQPRFGSCKGMLTIVDEDDEHLADFKDYMP
jgi:antitoxin (DNA-binding transcriptional repressor) of toxin-antitoxin stability system